MNTKNTINALAASSLVFGLLIGIFWGKSIVRTQEKQNQETQEIKNASAREFNLLMAIIYAARLDGEITPQRRHIIMNVLAQAGYSQQALASIDSLLGNYAYKLFDIHEILRQFKTASDKEQRLFLIKCLSVIAAAENTLTPAKKEFLEKTYTELDLP